MAASALAAAEVVDAAARTPGWKVEGANTCFIVIVVPKLLSGDNLNIMPWRVAMKTTTICCWFLVLVGDG